MGKIKLGLIAVFAVFAIYAAYMYVKVMNFIKTYKYGYEIKSVDTAGLNALANLGSGKSFVEIVFNIWIASLSDIEVTISDINVDFYFQGLYIGKSYDFATVKIAPKQRIEFPGRARLYLNKAMFNLVLAANRDIVRVDYKAKFKLFNLPFNFTYTGYYDFVMADYM